MSNTKPFGELTPEEKIELFSAWAHGAAIECLVGDWSRTELPCWAPNIPYRLAPTKDEVLWAALAADIQWVARDAYGKVFAYEEKPKEGESAWVLSRGKYVGLTHGCLNIVKVGTCDWRESLQERPQ